MKTKKKCPILIGMLMLMTLLVGCHGEFITTVAPMLLTTDGTTRTAGFRYDIYQKNGYYITVLKESDGSERDGVEYRVEINPYYKYNHLTGEYQFCVQQYYFNFFLPASNIHTDETTVVQPDIPLIEDVDKPMNPRSSESYPPQEYTPSSQECGGCDGRGWYYSFDRSERLQCISCGGAGVHIR